MSFFTLSAGLAKVILRRNVASWGQSGSLSASILSHESADFVSCLSRLKSIWAKLNATSSLECNLLLRFCISSCQAKSLHGGDSTPLLLQ